MRSLVAQTSFGVILFGVFQACSVDQPPEQDDSGRPIKIMTLGASERGWRRDYLGKIAAAQEVRIGFEVPGKIIEFPVKGGQKVEVGHLIARLDQTSFEADLAAAQAQARSAAADLERQRKLLAVGGVAKKAVEEAERLDQSAKSALQNAQKALRDTELRAPFAGLIAKTLVENFANVKAKEEVVTLQDPSWMEIKVAVPETDAILAEPKLTLAERSARVNAKVVVSSIPDRKFDAKISEFSTTADPVSRTYEATLIFAPPQDVSVLSGMTGHVEVKTDAVKDGSSGVRIPAAAVAGDDTGKSCVWVVGADMKVKRRTVTLGEMTSDRVQIKSGLQSGERIALSGIHYLREGQLVREWQPK
ncbi:MAG: efflux RND transporter periplasmic adaptor subunit [Planctomycetota bacterium]|nr:efflux RND transporter periplasmic adaptor subunit [Planctomycetota bacterium]